MSIPLLLEAYDKLPQPQPGDDPDLLHAGMMDAMREFRAEIRAKYTEGTLQRLLKADDDKTRRAAALAFGLVGTMRSNAVLAAALHDPDPLVRKLAADSLWEVWFRAGSDRENARLREAMQLPDHLQAMAAFDELVRDAPEFAEAVNQRAILRFRRGEYAKSAADCEAVLKLNPHHFGAAAGLGQCGLRMNRPAMALRAFRRALEIYPDLDGVRETVRELEAAIGKKPEE